MLTCHQGTRYFSITPLGLAPPPPPSTPSRTTPRNDGMTCCLANRGHGIKQDLQTRLNRLHGDTPATQWEVMTPQLADP